MISFGSMVRRADPTIANPLRDCPPSQARLGRASLVFGGALRASARLRPLVPHRIIKQQVLV